MSCDLNLTYRERRALYRAGIRFPDPRDADLQVRSVDLLWRQMVAKNILLKRQQPKQELERQQTRQHLGRPRLVVVR